MAKSSRDKTGKRRKSAEKKSKPAAPTAPEAPSPPATESAEESASALGNGRRSSGKIVSFVLLLLIVVAMGGLAYLVMRSFILPLFLAALLVVIFEPVDRWIRLRVRGRRVVSALITTVVILLVVLVPIIWVIAVGVTEAAQLAHIDRAQIAVMTRKLDDFRKRFGLQIPFATQLTALEKAINDAVPDDEDTTDARISPRSLKQVETQLADMEKALEDFLKDPDSDPGVRARVQAASNNGLQLMKNSCESLAAVDSDEGPTAVTNVATGLRADRLADAYRTFRVELLGGFPLAPLIELANPSPHDVEIWQSKFARVARSWLLYLGGEAGGFIASFAVGLAVMVLAMFYFILDGPDMIRAAMQLSPLDDVYEAEL
ncbi:MAG: AI-2E family transporter, partial [Planctomycetota bacterium]